MPDLLTQLKWHIDAMKTRESKCRANIDEQTAKLDTLTRERMLLENTLDKAKSEANSVPSGGEL